MREIEAWTDGATLPTNPGYMGVGFCACEDEERMLESWAYAGFGTSNQAELMALHFAISTLAPSSRDGLTLYTDSLYALRVIDGTWGAGRHAPLVHAIREFGVRIEGMMTDLVRGHSGVRGNERADRLAYQAASACVHFRRVLPVYLWAPSALKEFERRIIPRFPFLDAGARGTAFDLHQKIERGYRTPTSEEKAWIERLLALESGERSVARAS